MVRTESKVWQYFTQGEGRKATCKLCPEGQGVLSRGNRGQTTSLRNHLRSKHNREYTLMMRSEDERAPLAALLNSSTEDERVDVDEAGPSGHGTDGAYRTPKSSRKRKASGEVESGAPKTPKTPRLTKRPEWERDHVEQVRLVTMITRWICETSQPFAVVESESFVRMLKHATHGQYKPLCAKTFSTKRIPALFEFVKGVVNGFIDRDLQGVDGVGFTSDIWTSDTNAAFMSLTLHYIDSQFKLKRVLVRLIAFPEEHTGDEIAIKIDFLVGKLGIGPKIETWMTTDGGSNVRKGVEKSKLIQTGLWCVDHRIHLMITDVWKKCPLWAALSGKITRLVGHFSHSSKGSTKLRNEAKRLGLSRTRLSQRVPTRWNSDLKQLESVRDLWRALEEVALGDSSNTVSSLLPSLSEKLDLGSMINLLEHFNKFSVLVSSDTSPTLNEVVPNIFRIRGIMNNLSRNAPSALIGEVATFLVTQIDSRFPECNTNRIEFSMAHFLDPRYKGVSLRKIGVSYETTRDAVLAELVAAGDDTSSAGSSSSSSPSVTPPPPQLDPDDQNYDPLEACMREVYGDKPTKGTPQSSTMVLANCELELYTNRENGVAPVDRDILGWWKENSSKFPMLSRLAKKILAIPASSATSERVFSTAGEICSERRTNLSVHNIEMLVYLKENLRELNKHPDIVWPGFG